MEHDIYHNSPSARVFSRLFLASTLLISAVGCDSLLPSEFKEKEYTAPDIDVRACNQLSRNLVDSAGQVIDPAASYVVESRALASLVDSATRASLTDNQIIFSRFNALVTSLEPALLRDTLTLVQYPADQSVTYATLRVSSGQSKDVCIYTSLHFNQNNIGEYVAIQIVRNDTSLVSSSDDMPAEVATGCTQRVSVAGGEQLVPTIRARYRIHLEEGVYLVRFIISSPEAVGSFKMIIVST
jgi:hypothetical protein